MSERVIPHNLEAERSVLGAILIDNDVFNEAFGIVDASAFFRKAHALIFDAMVSLHDRGQPIDLVALKEELERHDKLEAAGGPAYIGALVDGVPRSTNVSYYAGIVREKATLRSLISIVNAILIDAYEADRSADAVVDDAERLVMQVGRSSVSGADFVLADDWMSETWVQIDHANESKRVVTGVASGIRKLDLWTRGWQASDLIYLGARPSAGKTSLMLQLALEASKHVMTGVISMEMSKRVIGMRAVAIEAGLDAFSLMTGGLSHYEFQRAKHAKEQIAERRFAIDDATATTATQLRAKVRRFASRYGLGMVFVDYMQLLHESRDFENRNQELARISAGLKSLARELDIPVFVLSQLSRTPAKESGGPQAHHLRDSGCLPASTRLLKSDGTEVSLGDLVLSQEQPDVLALNERWRLVPSRLVRAFPSGIKPVFRITLASGRQIDATANHQFRAIEAWKRLDALQVGDALAVPRVIPEPVALSDWSDDQLILLAHLLGDGSIGPSSVKYATADPANRQAVSDAASRLFGVETIGKQHGKTWLLWLKSARRLTHGKRHAVRDWLEPYGLWGSRSHNKFVPEAVHAQSNDRIALFLRHLWATRNRRGDIARVYYSTNSRRLAADVRRMLLRLNIRCRINQAKKAGYRNNYQVKVSSGPEMLRFFDVVGCYGERGDRISAARRILTAQKSNANVDLIPWKFISEQVRAAMTSKGITNRSLAKALGVPANGQLLGREGCPRNYSRDRLSRIANIVDSSALKDLAESDVFWDPIVAIDPMGDQPTFDATVEGTHNFIADGVIAHNSLEQDADVVLLLHRPNQHDEQKRLEDGDPAQLIIAKQRNGPTGSVKLQWIGEQMKFGEEQAQPKAPEQVGML